MEGISRVEEQANQETSMKQVASRGKCSSATSVDFQGATWRYILEDSTLPNDKLHLCLYFKTNLLTSEELQVFCFD
jgi:hypothetical protein